MHNLRKSLQLIQVSLPRLCVALRFSGDIATVAQLRCECLTAEVMMKTLWLLKLLFEKNVLSNDSVKFQAVKQQKSECSLEQHSRLCASTAYFTGNCYSSRRFFPQLLSQLNPRSLNQSLQCELLTV